MTTDFDRAWARLPDTLRAHPGIKDLRRAHLAALSAQEVPQSVPAGEWVDINDRVPDKGTDCLIWSQEPWEKAPSLKQDRWDEIHEAPVSFSTNTVYIGDGWVDDHACVTHWMKAPAGPGTAPAAPKQAEAQTLPERLMRFLLRDLKAERADLEGFLSLGNEAKRAAEYDDWIAAVESYCQQYAPAAPQE